jgi:hypothetical protein
MKKILKIGILLSIWFMILIVACDEVMYDDKLIILSVKKSSIDGYKYAAHVWSTRYANGSNSELILFTNIAYAPGDTIKIIK